MVKAGIGNYFRSSVGRKQIMAISGLGLCVFVLTHLLGNLTILVSGDTFNQYAHTLTSTKLIYLAEAGLAATFLVHIVLAIVLTRENRKARPDRYYMKVDTGRGATKASSSMIISGMILLVFLIIHIWGLKFGEVYETEVMGTPMRDLYKLTVETFKNPMYTAFYVIVVTILGFHLRHGFSSAFQSLGFNHPKYKEKLQTAGKIFGFLIAGGFSIVPLYVYFFVQGY